MLKASPVCSGLTFRRKKAILTQRNEVYSMKKETLWQLLDQFGMSLMLILLGLILLIVPDSASVIIAYLTAGILLLSGIVIGIGALLDRKVFQGICALVCLSVGGTLLGNPLLLARNLGRFLAVLLAMEGGTCLRKGNSLWGTVLLVSALVLCFAPMILSRLVFSLMGLAVLLIGLVMLADRIRNRKYLHKGDDNIIDAL